MFTPKRLLAATAAVGTLSVGAGVPAILETATPASASQSGLVNVNVSGNNVLDNNTTKVAANVCVNGVLSTQPGQLCLANA